MKKLLPFSGAILTVIHLGCAYFNTFYNATQFYQLAQDEISATSESEELSKNSQELLDKTIVRCNLVLSKYPDSRFRDDALMLRAKALYYLGESSASRTSLERLKNEFPESRYIMEANLWLIRCNWKTTSSGSSLEEIGRYLDSLGDVGLFGNVQALTSLAHTMAAEIYRSQGQIDSSLSHLVRAAESAASRRDRMNAHYQIAERAYDEKRLTIALANYQEVVDSHHDPKRVEKSHLQIVRIYREVERWAEASSEIERLTGNEKFSRIRADLSLELAKLYDMQGRDDEARRRYEAITEDFPKTAAAAESYYALGSTVLAEEKNYAGARKYFENVEREFRESTFTPSARLRVREISDLLSVLESIGKLDPELSPDLGEEREVRQSRVNLKAVDNTREPVVGRSGEEKDLPAQTIEKDSEVTEEDSSSSRKEMAHHLYTAGELLAFRFGDPDEGIKYFERIVNDIPRSSYVAQSLFSLNYLYHSQGDTLKAALFTTRLLSEYPESEFALEIARTQDITLVDTSAEMMSQAESLRDQRPREAIEIYQTVLQQYPETRYTPVVLLSMAHIYEHKLHDLESALELYRKISSDHNVTEQAVFATEKMALLARIQAAIADTSAGTETEKHDH